MLWNGLPRYLRVAWPLCLLHCMGWGCLLGLYGCLGLLLHVGVALGGHRVSRYGLGDGVCAPLCVDYGVGAWNAHGLRVIGRCLRSLLRHLVRHSRWRLAIALHRLRLGGESGRHSWIGINRGVVYCESRLLLIHHISHMAKLYDICLVLIR